MAANSTQAKGENIAHAENCNALHFHVHMLRRNHIINEGKANFLFFIFFSSE